MFQRYFFAPLVALLLAAPRFAQTQTGAVGIGTTAPDASAALDIVSTSKGVLLPRVADVTTIASPAPGLLLYQTGSPAGFYYNSGSAATPIWQRLSPGDNLGNHTATQALNLAAYPLVGNGGSQGLTISSAGYVATWAWAPAARPASGWRWPATRKLRAPTTALSFPTAAPRPRPAPWATSRAT